MIKRIHEGERNKKFLFFCVGVEPANFEILKKLAPPERPPVKLKGTKFKELFMWLSKSQIKVSSSKVGEKLTLEDPVKAGWGEIEL
ncbi:MAG: hypothetical protein ABIM44_06935 [candidate division WOR-3 bacterium]